MKQNVFIVALAAVVFVVVSAGASWDRSMDQDRHRSAGHRSAGGVSFPCEDWPYTMSVFDDTPQFLQAELCKDFYGSGGPISIDMNGDGDVEMIIPGYATYDIDFQLEGVPLTVIESDSSGQVRQYVVLDYVDVFQMEENPNKDEVRTVGVLDVTGDGMVDLIVRYELVGGKANYYYFENILTPPLAFCDEDVNEDGQIAVDDVLAVIAAWGDSCL